MFFKLLKYSTLFLESTVKPRSEYLPVPTVITGIPKHGNSIPAVL